MILLLIFYNILYISYLLQTFTMQTTQQIQQYLDGLESGKREDMKEVHKQILKRLPGIRLWFDDGKNEANKTVTNPTIGYGLQVIQYANGKTKDFFQIGISANSNGISVYILGLKDKTYLSQTYATKIGKAKITGYCIKFKSLKDINLDVLQEAIQYGVKETSTDR